MGVAERSGVSKAMLSQIESEKVNPTVATVWKIARGLDVELDSLLKGNGQLTSLGTSGGGLDLKVMSPISMAEDLEVGDRTANPSLSPFLDTPFSYL